MSAMVLYFILIQALSFSLLLYAPEHHRPWAFYIVVTIWIAFAYCIIMRLVRGWSATSIAMTLCLAFAAGCLVGKVLIFVDSMTKNKQD